MINEELVTGLQSCSHCHSVDVQTQSRKKEAKFQTEISKLEKSVAAKDDGMDEMDVPVLSYPVQATEGINRMDLARLSITSADCLSLIAPEVQKSLEWAQYKAVNKKPSYSTVDTQQIKILVVGDRRTGKSSLIQRTTTPGGFSCHYKCTHLLNCSCKTVQHKEQFYSVIIWDLTESTLDQEEKYFKEFCSGAMAAFIVYDLSRLSETLSSIADWKKKINNTICKKNGNPIPIYLLGNKCDLEGCQKDGDQFAKLHKFTGHFRTSAKTGQGIEEAMQAAVEEILRETHPQLPEICETPSHHKVQ